MFIQMKNVYQNRKTSKRVVRVDEIRSKYRTNEMCALDVRYGADVDLIEIWKESKWTNERNNNNEKTNIIQRPWQLRPLQFVANENRTTELYARRKIGFLCDDDDARGKAKSQARINYILDSICVPTYVLPYYKIRSKFQRKRKREDTGQFWIWFDSDEVMRPENLVYLSCFGYFRCHWMCGVAFAFFSYVCCFLLLINLDHLLNCA